MNRSSYRRYRRNRRYAQRYAQERAVEKAIGFVLFVLPLLLCWYAAKFVAIAFVHLADAGVTRIRVRRHARAALQHADPGALDRGRRPPSPRAATPSSTLPDAVASSTPVDVLTERLRADRRRQRTSAMEEWDREWARLLGSELTHKQTDGVGGGSGRRQSVNGQLQTEHILHDPRPRVGQRVVVVKRIPASVNSVAPAESGDSGTITYIGPSCTIPGPFVRAKSAEDL